MNELRCFGCMKLKTGRPECEHCGYDERRPNAPHQLQPGTVLQNQYVVGRVLGQGGFGITYIGWDSFLEIPVCIKEYYPNSVVIRNTAVSPSVFLQDEKGQTQYTSNLKRFAKEARSLAKLGAEERLNNIVRVQNLVQSNNTAYIIMEYVAGTDLRGHILHKGRSLTARETLELLLPLVEALEKIHSHGIIHRDISPDNIMVLPDGSAKLIDFGASHLSQMDSFGQQKSTEAIVKHGFAPMEQYSRKGNLGPWTDVYAMCATVYYCLTGQVLPPVMDRAFYGEEIDWAAVQGLNHSQLQAMKDGLALDSASRIQSMQELYGRLTAVEEQEQKAEAEPEPIPETEVEPEPGIPMDLPQQMEEAADFATEPVQPCSAGEESPREDEAGESAIPETVPVQPERLDSEKEEGLAEDAVSAVDSGILATEPVQWEAYTALLTPEASYIGPTVPLEQEMAASHEEEEAAVEPAEEKEATEPEEEIVPEVPVQEEELPVQPEEPEEIQEELPTEPEEGPAEESVPELPEQEESLSETPAEEPEEETVPEIPVQEEEHPVQAEEPAEEIIMELPEQGEEVPVETEETEPEEETSREPEETTAEDRIPEIPVQEERSAQPEDGRQEVHNADAGKAEMPEEPASAAPVAVKTPAPRKKRKAGFLAGLAAVLVCVVGLALGWMFLGGGDSAPIIVPTGEPGPDAWKQNILMNPYAGIESANLSDYEGQTVFGTEIRNDQIWSVTFLDSLAEAPKDSWDVSAAQNRSVRAWAESSGKVYNLYIAANGGINGAEACPNLFAQFTQVREIHFNDALHTEEAASLRAMFYNCRSLKQLDLGNFRTGKAADMRSMFAGCESLETLDVGSFDTANVEQMGYLFQDCRSLESLDLSSFDTTRVTAMNSMFSGCHRLKALNISSFDTANVERMSYLFQDCRRLRELDVSGFDTGNVTEMNDLFAGCRKLTVLDVTGFDTAKVTQMVGMFRDCRKLKSLDMNHFNTANVESMEQMFAGCRQLTALDLSSFDTANVGSMTSMFQDCRNLTDLNVTGFDTTKASLDTMFAGCRSLQQVDLSSFSYSERFGIGSCMFDGCSSLMNVNHPKINEHLSWYRADANEWRNNVLMNSYGGRERNVQKWDDLKETTVFGSTIRNDQIRSVTFLDMTAGAPEGVGWWDVSAAQNKSVMASVQNNGELYDLKIAARGGINARNCRLMFANFTKLEEINFNGVFRTEEATDMTGMFYNCRKLKELDLIDFDTAKVTSMHTMFLNCESLKELDLSSFDTSRVSDMTEMFGWVSLDELDLSSFDTRNVRDMGWMFREMKALKELDLGSFRTGSVRDMGSMFSGCQNLTELDLAGFDTRQVTNMENLFSGCKSLEMLDLSNFQTGTVTDMSGMFANCHKLTSLDVSSFHTSRVTDMSNMFYGCIGLTCLDLSTFTLNQSPATADMFLGCIDLKGVNHPQLNKLLPQIGSTESK